MNKVLLVAVRKMRDLNATSQKLKHEKLTHDVAFQSWLYSKAGQGSLSGQEEVNNAACCHEHTGHHHLVRPSPAVSGCRWSRSLCSTLQTSCSTNPRPADTGRCSNPFRHSVKEQNLVFAKLLMKLCLGHDNDPLDEELQQLSDSLGMLYEQVYTIQSPSSCGMITLIVDTFRRAQRWTSWTASWIMTT